jgi:hypothetical protein
MLDEAEFQDFVNIITEGDSKKIATWIKVLIGYPSGDPRLLPYLEALLDNKTLCIISIPFTHGEIRYLAAHALADERAKQGIDLPVKVTVIQPLTAVQIGNLTREAGIESSLGEGVFTKLQKLIDLKKAPTIDLNLNPTDRLRYQH